MSRISSDPRCFRVGRPFGGDLEAPVRGVLDAFREDGPRFSARRPDLLASRPRFAVFSGARGRPLGGLRVERKVLNDSSDDDDLLCQSPSVQGFSMLCVARGWVKS